MPPKKKPSMRTAADVISRILNDPAWLSTEAVVGYLDRVAGGILERALDDFFHGDISSVGGPDVLAIPQHRIEHINYRGEKVWEKSTRLDRVFGSTGNATIVKPHPMAILPLALTVRTLREVLAEEGLNPNVVSLAADAPDAPVTLDYLENPRIAMVDFTGSAAFGSVVRQKAGARPAFTEEAGVNPVVIAGTDLVISFSPRRRNKVNAQVIARAAAGVTNSITVSKSSTRAATRSPSSAARVTPGAAAAIATAVAVRYMK